MLRRIRTVGIWPVGALLCVGLASCAHQVELLNEEPRSSSASSAPELPLTVAIWTASFDNSRLNPEAVTTIFACDLRSAQVFQGVMHPVPAGVAPRWEIELIAADRAVEPDANRWKAFAVTVLPPLGIWIRFENDYMLEMEALLLQNRQLVRSYRAESHIRHRYQYWANRTKMDLAGVEAAVSNATRAILSDIAKSAPEIQEHNERTR